MSKPNPSTIARHVIDAAVLALQAHNERERAAANVESKRLNKEWRAWLEARARKLHPELANPNFKLQAGSCSDLALSNVGGWGWESEPGPRSFRVKFTKGNIMIAVTVTVPLATVQKWIDLRETQNMRAVRARDWNAQYMRELFKRHPETATKVTAMVNTMVLSEMTSGDC
jgi:hypothetical protein